MVSKDFLFKEKTEDNAHTPKAINDHPRLHGESFIKKKKMIGSPATREIPNSPGVKNLPSNAGDVSLIPGQGTKIPTKPVCCHY